MFRIESALWKGWQVRNTAGFSVGGSQLERRVWSEQFRRRELLDSGFSQVEASLPQGKWNCFLEVRNKKRLQVNSNLGARTPRIISVHRRTSLKFVLLGKAACFWNTALTVTPSVRERSLTDAQPTKENSLHLSHRWADVDVARCLNALFSHLAFGKLTLEQFQVTSLPGRCNGDGLQEGQPA